MEINATSQGNGGVNSLVSALPSIPADSRAVISDVAASTGLSDGQRTQLVEAVAAIDSGISSASLRNDVLAHVSGLGFYLKNTSDEGWPRWNVLTGLRLYGLNLDSSAAAPEPQVPSAEEHVVAQQVKSKLDSLARNSRGVSLEHVAVAVKAARAAPTKTPAPVEGGHKVEVVA